jgi:HSP20 family protein
MKLAKRERRENGPLSRLHEQIDRLFEEPFGRWLNPVTSLFEGWSPVVDVIEDKDNVFVKAELPGMKKEDIEVSVSGDRLNLAGERKEESEHKDANGYQAERYFGRFQRSIALPVPVQQGNVRAEYKDGILTITCPKSEEAKSKQIEIKVE